MPKMTRGRFLSLLTGSVAAAPAVAEAKPKFDMEAFRVTRSNPRGGDPSVDANRGKWLGFDRADCSDMGRGYSSKKAAFQDLLSNHDLLMKSVREAVNEE